MVVNVKIMSSRPATKPDDRPFDDASRVAVERGVGDLLHQLGVGGRQVLLDLPQDPLFVLGKRHRSHFRFPGPRAADPSCCRPLSRTALESALNALGVRTFPRQAMRRTVPDGTGTETGPHLVDRPLQRLPAARRRVGRRLRARRPKASVSSVAESSGSVAEERCPGRPDRGLAAHELLGRDAEQADAGRRRRARAQQLPGDPPQVGGEVGGLGQRARPGDGGEVAEAHLQLHGAARSPAPPAGATPPRRPGRRARWSSAAWSWRSTGRSPRARSTSPPGRAPPVARRGSTPARGGGGPTALPSAATSVSSGSAASSPTV